MLFIFLPVLARTEFVRFARVFKVDKYDRLNNHRHRGCFPEINAEV